MTVGIEKQGLKLVENEPIVKIKNVTKVYDSLCALNNISLNIPEGRIIGLPDKDGLPKDLKVSQIIALYSRFFDDFDERKCKELLNVFDIKVEITPKEMSKGMVDKLQICLLMARNARLYLLDEPIGGVDVTAREHVLDLIIENYNPQSTMLIVTHLVRDIEKIFDSVIVLSKGEIKAFDDCDTLREKYGGSLEDVLKEIIK